MMQYSNSKENAFPPLEIYGKWKYDGHSFLLEEDNSKELANGRQYTPERSPKMFTDFKAAADMYGHQVFAVLYSEETLSETVRLAQTEGWSIVCQCNTKGWSWLWVSRETESETYQANSKSEGLTEEQHTKYLQAFDETSSTSLNIGDVVVERNDCGTLYNISFIEGEFATVRCGESRRQVPIQQLRLAPPVMQRYSDLMNHGFQGLEQNQIGNVRGYRES